MDFQYLSLPIQYAATNPTMRSITKATIDGVISLIPGTNMIVGLREAKTERAILDDIIEAGLDKKAILRQQTNYLEAKSRIVNGMMAEAPYFISSVLAIASENPTLFSLAALGSAWKVTDYMSRPKEYRIGTRHIE